MTPKIGLTDVLRYYNLWKESEEKIYIAVSSRRNTKKAREQFKNYLSYMAIARNFKKGSIGEVFRVALQFKNSDNTGAVSELSEKLNSKKLLSGNNKNAFAASSKILWLFNRDFILMDSNCRQVLMKKYKTGKLDYIKYAELWIKFYNAVKPEIDSIINDNNLNRIDGIFGEEWFKKRVFDLYLINLNNK